MCDLNGSFKLCTCSSIIDMEKPYWILKNNKKSGDEYQIVVVGILISPVPILSPIIKKNILERLNSSEPVFDFNYVPKEQDLLRLVCKTEELYFEYNGLRWKCIDYWRGSELYQAKFKTTRKGYIKRPKLKL